MKKLQYTALLVLLIAFVLTGCSDNSDSLIGTWRYTISGEIYNLTIGETTWEMDCLDEVSQTIQDDSYKGTYVSDGDDVLTITTSQVYSSGWVDSITTYDFVIFNANSDTLQLSGDFGFGSVGWTFDRID